MPQTLEALKAHVEAFDRGQICRQLARRQLVVLVRRTMRAGGLLPAAHQQQVRARLPQA
ncbi:hypothetical protein D3C71_1866090 [compost metagenome]